MTGIVHFEAFLVTGILLNLTPGNDTVFILSKSIGQGKKAGIVSALGIGTGSLVHTLLAAFGLSLLLAKSMLLSTVIKFARAAYLLYADVEATRFAVSGARGHVYCHRAALVFGTGHGGHRPFSAVESKQKRSGLPQQTLWTGVDWTWGQSGSDEPELSRRYPFSCLSLKSKVQQYD